LSGSWRDIGPEETEYNVIEGNGSYWCWTEDQNADSVSQLDRGLVSGTAEEQGSCLGELGRTLFGGWSILGCCGSRSWV